MANPVDQALSHYTSQERQPAAVPELLNDQPPKQSHAEDHSEQIEATSKLRSSLKERQEGAPQSRSSTYESYVRNISSTSKTSAMSPRLQEGLRRGLARSFVGNHEEVQHQHQPYPSHQKLL